MSVTFKYTPFKKTVYMHNGTSTDVEAMKEVFGGFPMKLGVGALPILTAMEAASRASNNPYGELIEAIYKYDDILVELEY